MRTVSPRRAAGAVITAGFAAAFATASRAGRALAFIALACAALPAATPAHAERLKDLAQIQGVRDNPLIGYGLVVGLDGTGDQTTQTPFTTQTLANMLANLGISINNQAAGSSNSQSTLSNIQLKNVAAVMVTAVLPPFARPGEAIDVTVSSLGNARSLRGGTLLLTPLKGADGQVYALGQGNLAVGGAGASANGSRVQVNTLAAGRIASGAIVERAVPTSVSQAGTMQLDLNDMDYDTTQRVVAAVNNAFGSGTATALDGRTIQLRAPADPQQQVSFMAQLQNLDVRPAQAAAHGNLSVVINTQPVVSQPGAFSNGRTVVAQQSQIQMKQDNGALKLVNAGANLADVVKALNALGATPADLMSILQAMKAAGALRADLEII
jgi:flagellar P-ring protein precursor FlgI